MNSRDQLTGAMTELLWERGYAATSPRDAMVRAGIGQGTMHHHFSGKHELTVKALTAVSEHIADEASVFDGDGSPVERTFDAPLTHVVGSQLTIFAWSDNE